MRDLIVENKCKWVHKLHRLLEWLVMAKPDLRLGMDEFPSKFNLAPIIKSSILL